MSYSGTTFQDVFSEQVRGVPTFEPLDASDVADHIRAGDDASVRNLINDYLLVAREWVENEVQISLGQRTWTLYLDCFPCWEIELRLPPVQSVTSIAYLDTDNTSQTLSASLYRVDTDGKPGRIVPVYGQIWPYTYPTTKAVTITATVGYTSAGLVPACAKQAMRILTKMMYDGGGGMCESELDAVRRILDPIRWEGYA